MIKSISSELKKNRHAVYFILKMLGTYLLLQSLYDYVISPNTGVDSWLINLIISQVEGILLWMDYTLLQPDPQYTSHLGIYGTSGVVVGNPCDGLSLFILFASFLIVFNGKWWFKVIYILIGIALIHLLNVLRVLSLSLIVLHAPDSLDFHHSYTFTLFIYLIIFLFWMLRIKILNKKGI